MEDEQVEHIEHILRLFQQRVETYDAHTGEIIHSLSDPIVRVICDIFGVDEDSISWEEIDVSSPLIAMKFRVVFDSEDTIPEFANIISPAQPDENKLVRTITMAFPIIYTASSYEEFNEFMTTTINNAIKKQKRLTDTPVLTVDQQLQAYWHRPTRKVVH
jgi:hypothetical protein